MFVQFELVSGMHRLGEVLVTQVESVPIECKLFFSYQHPILFQIISTLFSEINKISTGSHAESRMSKSRSQKNKVVKIGPNRANANAKPLQDCNMCKYHGTSEMTLTGVSYHTDTVKHAKRTVFPHIFI